jgi:pyruvate/2-oxoglutarate dehydrogenase complex dihydrolipoamide dehydrogenase (E3) component
VKGYLLLDSGERHDFDHLLICTGSSYTSPFKFSYKTPEEAKAELAIICKAIQSAKSILIIGGGPTACEFAAEIQTESMDKNKAYDKTVTIVTSGDKILHGDPTAKDKLRVKLLGQMVKQKVSSSVSQRYRSISFTTNVW